MGLPKDVQLAGPGHFQLFKTVKGYEVLLIPSNTTAKLAGGIDSAVPFTAISLGSQSPLTWLCIVPLIID